MDLLFINSLSLLLYMSLHPLEGTVMVRSDQGPLKVRRLLMKCRAVPVSYGGRTFIICVILSSITGNLLSEFS
jgi:hypothetical protein